VQLTVLGGCGAWPAAGQACSGYLIEHEEFRLLVDPGYGSVLKLLETTAARDVDAVVVTHGHPDHCADLNPLLRARALGDRGVVPLPVFALPAALDAVLALDEPSMLQDSYALHVFDPEEGFDVGPFRVASRLLPHFVPNAGLRLTAGERTLVYTGDSGPSPDVVDLAAGADLLLAEATYVDQVPERHIGNLTSAREAAAQAARAGVPRLLLTHLWPGTDPRSSANAAAASFSGWVDVARPGTVVEI
jgi:ribonuclease BN (tRNA processing enzyme)